MGLPKLWVPMLVWLRLVSGEAERGRREHAATGQDPIGLAVLGHAQHRGRAGESTTPKGRVRPGTAGGVSGCPGTRAHRKGLRGG